MLINEALNVDKLTKASPPAMVETKSEQLRSSPTSSETTPMPEGYKMAAPLNEAELMGLLMASPLYKKLEDMKNKVANGNFASAPGVTPGKADPFLKKKLAF